MIQITQVIKVNQKKYKVRTDHKEIAFVVYKGDLLKYGFCEGNYIEKTDIDSFYEEVLLPRAKKRAMHLLEAREYSSLTLSDKLQKDGYPDAVIEKVLVKFVEYRYLDDERFTKAFLRTYSRTKSMNELKRLLHTKGISDECLERALAELQSDDELPNEKELIKKYIVKRKYNPECATLQERDKMFLYLRSKGFEYDLIKECIGLEE